MYGIDNQIVRLSKPYKDSLDRQMRKVMNVSEVELVKGKPESLFTNIIGDLLLEKGEEIVFTNKING